MHLGSDSESVSLATQGLYRGHGANVIRVIPEVMLKFGIHDQLRVICGTTAADQAQLPLSSRIAAGSITGVIRTALLHPLSVMRTRLTADMGDAGRKHHGHLPHPGRTRHYAGLLQCAKETWQHERIRGFYSGATVAAVQTVPYLMVCFSAYEALLSALPSDRDSMHEWWYPLAKMSCATGDAPAHSCSCTIQMSATLEGSEAHHPVGAACKAHPERSVKTPRKVGARVCCRGGVAGTADNVPTRHSKAATRGAQSGGLWQHAHATGTHCARYDRLHAAA